MRPEECARKGKQPRALVIESEGEGEGEGEGGWTRKLKRRGTLSSMANTVPICMEIGD